MIQAKANEQVSIEQVGGYKTMAGFMWTEAVSENETLRAQLAIAHGLLREACGSAFPVDDAETNYRILVPRQWLTAASAAGVE